MSGTEAVRSYGAIDQLPEVLDLLIVGGGPAGTAAAVRARELGLVALVVDFDDLMKRIRDYSKDKLILPGFGGGDRQRFPAGGEVVERLRFSPIDKDDLCEAYKRIYSEQALPALLGVELVGLEEDRGDGYRVLTYDHGSREERFFRARHVAIAIGRGVPRHLDLPGNTEGIAYRLSDPRQYVGGPACVIGGGTSAAEAVIAISNAKVVDGDATPVYWSYRGDKLPRVSRALAAVFFEAYVGNGNIRYYPRSEPAAITTGDDRLEYLAIRVDRRCIDGRPHETIHLEFPKERSLACIGEDLPTQLLGSLGIERVEGGPRARPRIVVNRFLESVRPNLYLIGDLLSQVYLEADDFDADPAGFREVKHRGNIKTALRDGVLVAQVVAQRLAGAAEVEVVVADAEEEPERARIAVGVAGDGEEEPAAASGPGAGERDGDSAVLVDLLPGGVQGDEHRLQVHGVTTLGRTDCDISFPNDTLLSVPHASVAHTEEGWFLRDDGSRSGVFLRLPVARPVAVDDGDLVRVGRQFLVLSRGPDGAAVTHYDAEGNEVGRHALQQRTMVAGRRAPDLTLDEDDRTLSRRQLAISWDGESIRVKDLKSMNGSFLRVRAATRLEHGQQFRIGQQALALSLGDRVLDTEEPATPAAKPAVGQIAAASRPEDVSGPAVTFQPAGLTVPVAPGQTLCEAAEAAGIELSAECHSGICGSDPIRVLQGAEHLEPLDDQERDTLEEICELEPGRCRLACMVRIRGAVEVEIL